MKINVIGGEMSKREIDEYILYVSDKYRSRQVRQLDLEIEGEFVNMKVYFGDTDFQHSYRSTDYLVNDINKLNDAKQMEFNEKKCNSVEVK